MPHPFLGRRLLVSFLFLVAGQTQGASLVASSQHGVRIGLVVGIVARDALDLAVGQRNTLGHHGSLGPKAFVETGIGHADGMVAGGVAGGEETIVLLVSLPARADSGGYVGGYRPVMAAQACQRAAAGMGLLGFLLGGAAEGAVQVGAGVPQRGILEEKARLPPILYFSQIVEIFLKTIKFPSQLYRVVRYRIH